MCPHLAASDCCKGRESLQPGSLSCSTHFVCPTAAHRLLPTRRCCAAPTLEVFFARQPPGTGVKRHTDYVNFVQTTHLGLIVPEGDCWMKARPGGRGAGAGQGPAAWGWTDEQRAT